MTSENPQTIGSGVMCQDPEEINYRSLSKAVEAVDREEGKMGEGGRERRPGSVGEEMLPASLHGACEGSGDL